MFKRFAQLAFSYCTAADTHRYLEKYVQRYKDKQATEHIGRGYDHGQHEQNKEGIPATCAQELWCKYAYARKEVDQHGQLEYYAEGEYHIAHGIVVVIDSDNVLEERAEAVVAKEIDGVGCNDEVGETYAHEEQQGTPEHDAPCGLYLAGAKSGFYELPQFPQYIGEHDDEAQHGGYRKAHHELAGNSGVLELHGDLVHTERL